MKNKTLAFILSVLLAFICMGVLNPKSLQGADLVAGKSLLLVDDIIKRVEKRYAVCCFSAHFFQVSTIKAMEITDTASGKAFFKHSGKMRWEYQKPERQIIITDAETLWIFRPDDDQVMVGKAPNFFGSGKGASFLADMSQLEKKFSISLGKSMAKDLVVLKLLPKEKMYDVSEIYLSISTDNFNIVQIVTYNSYRDENLIQLSDIKFKHQLDDSMFKFKIPEGVEVLQLDE